MSIKDLILVALLAAVLPFAHAESTEPQTEPATPAEPMAEQQKEQPAQEELVQEELVEEQEEPGMSEEEFLASLNFQTGKVVLGDNLASLNLPENLVFLDGNDANRVLVDAWGNPPTDEAPLGMILPAGISPLAEESWAVTVEFEESGFVSDEDAADIDYAEMLEQLQEETVESNAWRAENGYEPIELLGWAAQPHYDEQGKKLHWAKELRFGDSDINTLNYNIRVLGRKGVLVLNFIANMDQLPEIQANVPAVLAMTEFNDGNRYADFNPDIDQVAAYGIGALIAGKLAAKAGLFATILLLLKKFWLVPVLLFGWLVKLFTGKK